MRVNVYAEELTDDIEVVQQFGGGHPRPFFGLRIYLRSPSELHHTPEDDDRSAVTFWFDSTAALNDFREALYTKARAPR
jgi:hypothetical protein